VSTTRVAIVGAGPYALSTALFLQRAGVESRVLGEVMGFWQSMPSGMFLRSYRKASSIADPDRELTLDAYERKTGKQLGTPITLEGFIEYGGWFQRQAGIEVDARRVERLAADGNRFELGLSDGEMLGAEAVVVAAGIAPFTWRPPLFEGLGPGLASHTSEHRDYDVFRGRRVLVVGAGQSALEAAALLAAAGAADIELLVRRPALRFLHGEGLNEAGGLLADLLYPEWAVGPPGINLVVGRPRLYRLIPPVLAEPLAYRAIRPAASAHLRDRLAGVKVTTSKAPVAARQENGAVRVELDDGSGRLVDHVVLGTGYRIDLGRYTFLDRDLLGRIRLKGSSPRLSASLESSVPGLYFVGAPAAASAGPGFRFVSHSGFAARAIARHLVGR
jgi:Pyridine nucleotide-disulphide oxidoreductase